MLDLEQALETLSQAIKRIDKETQIRFRDTFDKVNEDLKSLFPKVFGAVHGLSSPPMIFWRPE